MQSMEKFREIFSLRFSCLHRRQVFSQFDQFIAEKRARSVFIANTHTVNLACSDRSYRDVLNSSDLLLNDGVGVDCASYALHGKTFSDNLVGTDLVPDYIEHCRGFRDLRIFVLGSFQEIVSEAAKTLKSRFPWITIAGYHHGYFTPDENQKVIRIINMAAPDILMVGFGNPKQEKWIAENLKDLSVPICIGVGGFIDHLGGHLKRAPGWVKKLRMEWVQILLQQPRLKWRRYLIGNPAFLLRILIAFIATKLNNLKVRRSISIKSIARKSFIMVSFFFSLIAPKAITHRKGLRILTYHRVCSDSTDSFSVSRKEFERQMAYLSENYTVLPLPQALQVLENGEPYPDNVVTLTFDDGSDDWYSVVYPVLKRFGIPATFFVTVNLLEDSKQKSGNEFLTWEQLSRMAEDPICCIGSHSLTHRSFASLSKLELENEIIGSKRSIEKRICRPVEFLSYPFGTKKDFNKSVCRAVSDGGYLAALTSINGLNTSRTDRIELRRTKVVRTDSFFYFKKIVDGHIDQWKWIDRFLWLLQKREKVKLTNIAQNESTAN